jgi:hypothetical protein
LEKYEKEILMNLNLGDLILFVIFMIAIFFPFYWVYRIVSGKRTDNERELDERIAKNNERIRDLVIAKLGIGYIDDLLSRNETIEIPERKIEEIRQWTAAYGDEEARRMYKEKYCNDKFQPVD